MTFDREPDLDNANVGMPVMKRENVLVRYKEHLNQVLLFLLNFFKSVMNSRFCKGGE